MADIISIKSVGVSRMKVTLLSSVFACQTNLTGLAKIVKSSSARTTLSPNVTRLKLSLTHSLFLSLFPVLSPFLFLSIPLSVSPFLSLSPSLSLSLSFSQIISLSLSLSLYQIGPFQASSSFNLACSKVQ